MAKSSDGRPEPALVLLADAPQKIQLRIVNRSGAAWPAQGADRVEFLHSWVRPDGSEVVSDETATALATDLAHGGVQTISLLATPPAAPFVQLRLRRRRAGRPNQPARLLADRPIVVAAPEAYARGAIAFAEPIPPLPAGAGVSIPLLLRNDSDYDWDVREPALFNLRGRLGAEQFSLRLAQSVAPGESSLIRLPLTMPDRPGRYPLRIVLARPGIVNFNDTNAFDVPKMDLQVVEADSAPIGPAFRRAPPRMLLDAPSVRPVGLEGEPLTVGVGLLNDDEAQVRLSYLEWNWLDGPEPAPAERLALDTSLMPGVRRRVELSLAAPEPGIFRARLRLSVRVGERDDPPFPIGDLEVEIVERESVIELAAEILSPPAALIADEEQMIALRITNNSARPLATREDRNLFFTQRWTPLDSEGPPQSRGRRRLAIPPRPGDAEVLLLPLTPPADGGRYLVDFQARRLHAPADDRAVDLDSSQLECEVARMNALSIAAEKRLRRDLAALTAGAERAAYLHWAARRDSLPGPLREEVAAWPARWPWRPTVSVLLPLPADRLALAAASVRSVRDQIYQDWRLCLGHDAAVTPAALREALGEALDDPRVRLAAAPDGADVAGLWRQAAAMADGDYCQLLFPGDGLAAHALLYACGEVVRDAGARVLYSDRDRLDAEGARHSPSLLPGPDPDLALGQDYVGRSLFAKTDCLLPALPQDAASSAAWYHELAVGLLEAHPAQDVRHIRNVLYHCGPGVESGPADWTAAEDALNRRLARAGRPARVSCLHGAANYRLRRDLPTPAPRVSIIIPTRDGLALLSACISSIVERTDYPDYEIIVMDNGSERPDMLDYLRWLAEGAIATVIRDDGDFNWSRLNNTAAARATGDIYCLLNDDTEVLSDSWLRELVAHAVRPDVGAVGAALWFPDGRLQHGGISFDFASSLPFSNLRRADRDTVRQILPVVQSSGAVTGACLVTRRDVYQAAGGMDQVRFPIGYNDIDYCLRVRDFLGLRCVWTPFADLLHKESVSRGRPRTADERDLNRQEGGVFAGRWRDSALRDPHFRPDFDLAREFTARPRPGAVARRTRYRLPRARPIAFAHLPRTAGAAVLDLLQREAGGLSVSPLSARVLLGCYAGDAAILAELRRWLGDVDVLVAHLSHGFGARIGWDCAYATLLRDPVERVASQHRCLLHDSSSPLWRSPIADAPLDLLLRKGVLAGNLQLHKILGRPPEAAPWSEIDGVGADFAGFDLPPDLWRRRFDGLLERPDIVPEADLALVDEAMAIIERDFAFVGRQEALDTHMVALFQALGLDEAGASDWLNVTQVTESPAPVGDLETVRDFHRLDLALYARIAELPGGLLINEALLAGGGG